MSLLSKGWSYFICSLLANPHHEGAAYFMRDIIRDSVISYNLGPQSQ